jgi:hypothetical protein
VRTNSAAQRESEVAEHVARGRWLHSLDEPEEAARSFEMALRILPDHPEANAHIADALQELGRFEEAVRYYARADRPSTRAPMLACLYALGRHDELFDKLVRHRDRDATNLEVAAIAGFASIHLGRDNPHRFCPDPLDLVRIERVDALAGAAMDGLRSELGAQDFDWEPFGQSISGGYQTRRPLFRGAAGPLAQLERVLHAAIARYRNSFRDRDCTLIRAWPAEWHLDAWAVRLLPGGSHHSHIHPAGWLSGSLYIDVPDRGTGDEGAIEFGRHGYNLPVRNPGFPRRTHRPCAGDLTLFPSSLFHRTIPTGPCGERICLSFDVVPNDRSICR